MILVSGATGNIGRPLVERLLEAGAPVRVLVRDPSKVAALGSRVEVAVGDLEQPETLPAAMRGVEQLFFLTPQTHQVRNLLEAARQSRVRHVVKISTIEADRYLGPGKWHREQEEMIRAAGFEWTFLRPTMMMSNTLEWWGATVKARNAVYFPGGKGKLAPVDSRDVAAAAAAALVCPEHRGQVHVLTGPESLSIGEMVQILSRELGKPLRYVNIPPFLAAISLRKFGLPPYVVSGLMETLRALRRNEYAYVTDTVERLSGTKPRSYERWVRENAPAFR